MNSDLRTFRRATVGYSHGTTIGDPASIVPHETVTITFVNRLRVIGTPGLDIEKYAYAEDEAWTDVTSVLTGTTVTYEIWVFNYGGVTLHHVTIEDDLVDVTSTECANVPDLKPDEAFDCEYTDIAKTGTTKNTATVDSDETGPESAAATVIGYAEWPVTITKTNDAPLDAHGLSTLKEGDTVSFTLILHLYGCQRDLRVDGGLPA